MTDTQAAIELLSDRLEVLLNEAEEELERPLEPEEVDSITSEFLAALDEGEDIPEDFHPDVPAANADADEYVSTAVCPKCGEKGTRDPETGKCKACGADWSEPKSDETKPDTPGDKGDKSMAKNSTRQDTIAWLTTNCDCWKNKAEVLADPKAFTDDDLARFKSAQEKAKADAATIAVNAGKQDSTTLTSPTVNSAGTTSTSRPQTDEEWLASAPPRIRAGVERAMAINQREKDATIARLVANVSDEVKRQKAAAVYAALPPEQLADLAASLPTTNERPAFGLGFSDYSGAAALTANTMGAGGKDDSDNVLPEFTYSYEDAAAERQKKKAE